MNVKDIDGRAAQPGVVQAKPDQITVKCEQQASAGLPQLPKILSETQDFVVEEIILETDFLTEEEHRKRNRPEAEANVKAGLVLGEIAEQEGINVTPEEVETRIQLLKGQYQDQTMQAELDKPESRQDIANRLMTEKTIAKIIEYNRKKS